MKIKSHKVTAHDPGWDVPLTSEEVTFEPKIPGSAL